jgi:hypothetical protein
MRDAKPYRRMMERKAFLNLLLIGAAIDMVA